MQPHNCTGTVFTRCTGIILCTCNRTMRSCKLYRDCVYEMYWYCMTIAHGNCLQCRERARKYLQLHALTNGIDSRRFTLYYWQCPLCHNNNNISYAVVINNYKLQVVLSDNAPSHCFVRFNNLLESTMSKLRRHIRRQYDVGACSC